MTILSNIAWVLPTLQNSVEQILITFLACQFRWSTERYQSRFTALRHSRRGCWRSLCLRFGPDQIFYFLWKNCVCLGTIYFDSRMYRLWLTLVFGESFNEEVSLYSSKQSCSKQTLNLTASFTVGFVVVGSVNCCELFNRCFSVSNPLDVLLHKHFELFQLVRQPSFVCSKDSWVQTGAGFVLF